jgi:hypothetical protein
MLTAAPALAQEVSTAVSRPQTTPMPRGQIVIDIATVTRHPAYLEPMSLKTPEGVRILSSVAAPDNAQTCPRGASSGSECRQIVRALLDTGTRCHAGGDYEALFRINCWPGTAASLCKPGAYQFNFKLANDPSCHAP